MCMEAFASGLQSLVAERNWRGSTSSMKRPGSEEAVGIVCIGKPTYYASQMTLVYKGEDNSPRMAESDKNPIHFSLLRPLFSPRVFALPLPILTQVCHSLSALKIYFTETVAVAVSFS